MHSNSIWFLPGNSTELLTFVKSLLPTPATENKQEHLSKTSLKTGSVLCTSVRPYVSYSLSQLFLSSFEKAALCPSAHITHTNSTLKLTHLYSTDYAHVADKPDEPVRPPEEGVSV